MKNLALALGCLLCMNITQAQTVFTYGKKAVSKDEFMRAFNKNPVQTGNRQAALREYLDLYINFKLKVQAAYDAGLDQDPTQQYELQNFKRQVAENIINEKANIKQLVKEAFDRSQKDVHLAHVLVEVPAKGDTAAAYKTIQAAYKALQQGQDFATVAATYSTDQATIDNKGDLGHITVFTLPYEFENIAYSIKPGQYTAPVRTSLGYHIFKNLGERAPWGTRQVAQILIAFPPDGTPQEKAAAKAKADSVYQLMHSGSSFESMVVQVSNDMSSVHAQGQLPEFGIGTYNPLFEKEAFALKQVGDISRPFASPYGYHILKLVKTTPVEKNADDIYLATLQEKVMKDGRLMQAKKAMLDKQLATLKYTKAAYPEADLFAYTDSNWQNGTAKPVKAVNEKTVLFSFATQKITASDWVQFVKAVKSSPNEFSGKDYPELMKDYVRVTADEYFRANLDKFSDEYASQVNEFKEANLLFGIMDKYVWGKASEDTAGLQAHYRQNMSKYKWAPSADALIITAANKAQAGEVKEALQQKPLEWRNVLTSFSNISYDSGRYEITQLPVENNTTVQAGAFTLPVQNETDGSATFTYIVKTYPQPGQRSFDDARGMVISDYQQVLEERWIAELRKKYPVKVNEAVYRKLQ